MSVSQKQIAEALNLSIITVSRALRDHPDLAQKTKTRVLDKAAELGYNKKHRARSAVAQSSHPVPGQRRAGIIIYSDEEAPEVDLLKSTILRRIFLSLQKECQRLGIETLIETSYNPPTKPLLIRNGIVDSVFLLGRYTTQSVEQLGDIPALAVSSFIECPGLPRVVADNFHGMRIATEHLIELGHRKILFITYQHSHTQIFRERAYGYFAAMHNHGLSPHTHDLPLQDAPLPLENIAPYSAVVCSSDSIAYMLQNQLLSAGWKLPQQCSIVAFDNNTTHPGIYKPVTSYAPDWDLMGKTAADLLFSQPIRVQGSEIVVTIPGKLAIHESCCKPSAG
jgi:DNA-binding LacI/PurR family transcriptional regulator